MNPAATLDEWADRYGSLKASAPGAPGAWLKISLIVSSLIGMLWTAPVPSELRDASPVINYATLFIMASFVYYCILSISLGLTALLFLLALLLPTVWMASQGLPVESVVVPVFLVAFTWQLVETKHATGRALPIRNLQYLMLGPIWLLRGVFRRLGIRY